MRTARVSWLVALTLAAATLPASRRAAPVRKDTSTATRLGADSESRGSAPHPKDQPGKRLMIAPMAELWDGGSTRPAGKAIGPVLVDMPPGGEPLDRVEPLRPWRIATGEPPDPCVPHPAGWLIGHYAHAPPA